MNTNSGLNIKKKVIDIIAEVCLIDKSEITVKATLQEDLCIDSVDIVSLVLGLEDEFGGTITDEEAENLRTVGDVITHIELKLKEAQ
jgi:acyl carrier protein